jgi:uncharacterized protein with ParB-like and HNH nuclease domain
MKILERNSNNINIATFWENCQLDKYNFNPDYQRPSNVWAATKKSFLIDTIMKNFPMPPIFLHQHIDVDTGKTIYDVIDGKQRLTTIISFINNEIPLPDDFSSDSFGNEKLNGLFFKDLENPEIDGWKKSFWKYELTIEYVDTDQIGIVNNIFDRLNRNGEPLTAQELRNAKFHSTEFYNLVRECSELKFWDNILSKLEKNRLEHHEFISELLFVLLENQIYASDRTELVDELFEKYSIRNPFDKANIEQQFNAITDIMESFNLDYEKYRIYGVSHLYGIFGLAWVIQTNNLQITDLAKKLGTFYTELRNKSENPFTTEYQISMNAGTKSKARKTRRINALLNYLGQNSIE